MAKQKFGLGRGLDALISGASEVMSAQQQQQPTRSDEEAVPQVAIDSIIPNPRQPRKIVLENDPEILELSESIKEHGLIQPIVVARLDRLELPRSMQRSNDTWFDESELSQKASVAPASGAAQYQIIAGERRWRASRLAGLTKVPVLIKDVTPQQMLELALIENIQRSDLNPIEEALAYQSLIQEFGLTQEMVAKRVGKARSTIANSIGLLQLATKVREALVNQRHVFTEGHARALVGITREEDQVTLMGKVVTLGMTVRETEAMARDIKEAQDMPAVVEQVVTRSGRASEINELETSFRNALTVKVDLRCNAKGKGTLVLHFNNQEELERLYSQLVKHEG